MAEKSSFFTSLNGDRKYKSSDFAEYFSTFIGNGVFPNPSTNLLVTANGDMTINLSPGFAWINGYMYHNTDNLTLTVEYADSALKRIDRVVLRCDFISREIKAYIKKGIFASNPIAPDLERGVNAYELSISDILVENGVISIQQSKITDTRLDESVCGIVTQTVKEIETSELYRKLQGYIDERGQDVQYWMETSTTQWEVDFNTWFETIKDILSGDVAGELANRILELENKVGSGLTADNILMPDGSSVKASILKQEKDIESLKLSVSNGKELIASAITDKGIDTSNEDSFQIMANNIENIKTGINVNINDTPIDYDFDLNLFGTQWLNIDILPYDYFYQGSAVIFNGEIHILGGATSDVIYNHYKYSDKKWVSVSTLPCRFSDGSAVVLNGEIHILGGDSIDNYMNHYKYNGSEWISVSTLPYPFYRGCALIYNDEIHILGTDSSNYKTCHYKFDGISWTSVSTLPYGFSNGCAVIINEEIHILGPVSYHYKYNGDSWTSVSSIPYSFSSGCAVIFNGEIHILGGTGSSGGIYTYYRHSKYNGSSWTYLDNIPFQFYNGCSLVINRGITLLGSGSSSYRKSHYNCVEVYDIVRKEG